MLKILTLFFSAALLLSTIYIQSFKPLAYYMTFAEYKKIYNLHFENKFEERFREIIYNQNVIGILKHNHKGSQSYTMGINQFTYLTKQEFVEIFLGTKIPSPTIQVDDTYLDVGEIDWSSKGAVTSIKNQGSCGACWAFSTTGALQGLSKIGYNNLQTFSQQQLIDCSGSYGNMGCFGGSMIFAYKYVQYNGITIQSLYPYVGVKGICRYNQGSFRISSFNAVLGCPALTHALLSSPISVAVDATNWAPYQQGIFGDCGSAILNHGVLLVGISDNYWKIKNSWGPGWGEKGYIKISRGNTCGICNQASYPIK